MIPSVDNNLDHLNPTFRKKVDLFLSDAKAKGFDIVVYEAKRSLERQKYLYSIGRTAELVKKPVTWTLQSKHLDGLAVDIVFIVNKAITWNGDYAGLRAIAIKYQIGNLGDREFCHFEDNGIPYVPPVVVVPVAENKVITSYTGILDAYIKDGYVPVFTNRGTDRTLTEQETKELIEIGLARKGK